MSGNKQPRRWLEASPNEADALRAARLLQSLPPPAPPAHARARVLSRLATARSGSRPASLLRWGVAGAALGAAVVGLVLWSGPRSAVPPERHDLAVRPGPRLFEVSGEVKSGAPAREVPARPGLELSPGARLVTGPDGRSVLGFGAFFKGELSRGSTLEVLGFDRGVRLALHEGALLSRVLSTPAAPLELAMDRVSMAASSAVFRAERGADGLRLEVQSGEVDLALAGVHRTLRAGERWAGSPPAAALEPVAPPRPVEPEGPSSRRLQRRVLGALAGTERAAPPAVPEAPAAPVEDEIAALYGRARAERDPVAAIALFDQVAARGGAFAEVSAHQAARLSLRIGRCTDAIERYTALLEARPRGPLAPEARLDVIECRLKLGELDVARRELLAFERLYPDSERLPELRALREELARRRDR